MCALKNKAEHKKNYIDSAKRLYRRKWDKTVDFGHNPTLKISDLEAQMFLL